MKKLFKPLIFVATTAVCSLVTAEELAVPAGQQGASQNVPRPKSGLSMDQVNARFGSPGQQIAAVGEPPISRWVYDAYTVYFERDRVIHSVLHPAP